MSKKSFRPTADWLYYNLQHIIDLVRRTATLEELCRANDFTAEDRAAVEMRLADLDQRRAANAGRPRQPRRARREKPLEETIAKLEDWIDGGDARY
jgi:hypothetical protein